MEEHGEMDLSKRPLMQKLVWKKFIDSSRVRVFSLALSILFLAISGFALQRAYATPINTEERVTVLEYHQAGTFDYLAHPKIETILGTPQESEEPGQICFTELIDDITVSFAYEFAPDGPVNATTSEAEIVAIVANPDLWEKELVLVPTTVKEGDFTIHFPLDLLILDEMIETIETEVGIVGHSNVITLQARVHVVSTSGSKTIEDDFVQSMTVTRGGRTLELDSSLDGARRGKHDDMFYWHRGRFDYAVRLKPNNLFGPVTLKPPPSNLQMPPKAMTPDNNISIEALDVIFMTFSHNFKSDEPVTNLSRTAEITAVLEDATHEWSKPMVLLVEANKSNDDLTLTFPLDIGEFTKETESAHHELDIPSLSPELVVKAEVHTSGETAYRPLDETFTQTMRTNMSGGKLWWGDELTQSASHSITKTVITPHPKVKTRRTYLTIPTALLGIMLLYFLWLSSTHLRKARPSAADQEAHKAKKKYKGIIIDVEELPQVQASGDIVPVHSLTDLIRLSDSLLKPVLHKVPANEGEPHAYFVFDGTSWYKHAFDTENATGAKREVEGA